MNDLEHELEQARRHGRWLADDELVELKLQQQGTLQRDQSRRSHRHKLLILTAICVLIPPLWPLALGLVLYLLFPRTTRRFGLLAGVALLLGGALVAALLLMLLAVLLVALF
ncbi:MAG: hypothetical protein VKM98_07140 [Cyanobacteriota bacterium]|nr:hypothetical protein [Cyanobacteriota bacterium]